MSHATNPTARETLHNRLFQFVGGATRVEMLDAYRAEVLTEAAEAADFHSDFFMAAELRRMAAEAGESCG